MVFWTHEKTVHGGQSISTKGCSTYKSWSNRCCTAFLVRSQPVPKSMLGPQVWPKRRTSGAILGLLKISMNCTGSVGRRWASLPGSSTFKGFSSSLSDTSPSLTAGGNSTPAMERDTRRTLRWGLTNSKNTLWKAKVEFSCPWSHQPWTRDGPQSRQKRHGPKSRLSDMHSTAQWAAASQCVHDPFKRYLKKGRKQQNVYGWFQHQHVANASWRYSV